MESGVLPLAFYIWKRLRHVPDSHCVLCTVREECKYIAGNAIVLSNQRGCQPAAHTKPSKGTIGIVEGEL